MRDKILLIIEKFGIGGVETHVASLANALKGEMDIYIAAFEGENVSYFQEYFKGICVLKSNASLEQNLSTLIQFSKKHNISKIHAHQPGIYGEAQLLSFATKKPLFLTVHGIVHPVTHWREMIPVRASYWDKVVFRSAAGISTVSSQHIPFLEEASPSEKGKIVITRNCIGEESIKYSPSLGKKSFFIAIRLEKEKERALRAAIDFVLYLRDKGGIPEATLTVAGDGALELAYLDKYKDDDSINFIGNVPEVSTLINDFDCIIGTGRAALEGVAAGKMVFIFGPWGEHGILTPANFEDFSLSNFNGRYSKVYSFEEIASNLKSLTQKGSEDIVRGNHDILVHDFGSATIRREVRVLYDRKDDEKLDVEDLLTLLAKADKYIIAEKRYMAELVSARQDLLRLENEAQLQGALLEEKDAIIQSLLSSKSWKITAPIRRIRRIWLKDE